MQSHYAEAFDREYGCTEAEWLGWLPAALGEGQIDAQAQQACQAWGDATLTIRWKPLSPRVIALAQLPRLWVEFRFQGVTEAQRYVFMRRFDLYMQRGGG